MCVLQYYNTEERSWVFSLGLVVLFVLQLSHADHFIESRQYPGSGISGYSPRYVCQDYSVKFREVQEARKLGSYGQMPLINLSGSIPQIRILYCRQALQWKAWLITTQRNQRQLKYLCRLTNMYCYIVKLLFSSYRLLTKKIKKVFPPAFKV